MNSNQNIPSLIEQLQHKSSPKRRAAAKKIRTLAANEAGPALLSALKRELNDKRTWETQYQMIMALGESGYSESLDFLIQLTEQDFEATMVYVAIGDAITRLTYFKEGSINSTLDFLENKNDVSLLIDGIMRAIVILKLIPSVDEIERIINYGNLSETSNNNRTWIASAAAGWSGENVEKFLNRFSTSDNPQTKKAAEAALNKKYSKWDIL